MKPKLAAMTSAAPLLACWSLFISHATVAADGPREVQEATAAAIESFVHGKQMKVLMFTGYSDAEYEDSAAMLKHASRVLDQEDPLKTLINIGATKMGIGAVYELAKRKGFATMGIASTLARDKGVSLSEHVDHVFYVRDSQWGGKVPGTDQLSPTSAAIVQCSTSCVAIGGGDVTRDEIVAARKAGKPVIFIPADMNHKIAREKARNKGQPEPTDFRGSAHEALSKSAP